MTTKKEGERQVEGLGCGVGDNDFFVGDKVESKNSGAVTGAMKWNKLWLIIYISISKQPKKENTFAFW